MMEHHTSFICQVRDSLWLTINNRAEAGAGIRKDGRAWECLWETAMRQYSQGCDATWETDWDDGICMWSLPFSDSSEGQLCPIGEQSISPSNQGFECLDIRQHSLSVNFNKLMLIDNRLNNNTTWWRNRWNRHMKITWKNIGKPIARESALCSIMRRMLTSSKLWMERTCKQQQRNWWEKEWKQNDCNIINCQANWKTNLLECSGCIIWSFSFLMFTKHKSRELSNVVKQGCWQESKNVKDEQRKKPSH